MDIYSKQLDLTCVEWENCTTRIRVSCNLYINTNSCTTSMLNTNILIHPLPWFTNPVYEENKWTVFIWYDANVNGMFSHKSTRWRHCSGKGRRQPTKKKGFRLLSSCPLRCLYGGNKLTENGGSELWLGKKITWKYADSSPNGHDWPWVGSVHRMKS